MSRQFAKMIMSLILALIIGFGFLFPVYSQSNLNLSIEALKVDKFPLLESYVSVSSERGVPISKLAMNNFSLAENGLPISTFEVQPVYEQPISLVLTIDTSDSMSYGRPNSALAAVIATVKEFVATLGSSDQIAVLAFSNKVIVVQELTQDKTKVFSALDNLQTEQNAMLNNAIAESSLLLQNFSGRRAVLFITDSIDAGYQGYSFDQALDIAQHQNATFLPIYWGGARKEDMQKLSSLTNGKSFELGTTQPGTQDIQAVLNEVKTSLTGLREQYLIRYTSTLPANGTEQELNIKVDYQGAHAEQSRKFLAQQGNVSVNLKGLVDGQTTGGKVEIVPDVSSPGELSKIEILVDNNPVQSISGAPFTYNWDASTLPVGMHVLKVVATDSSGNSGEILLNLNIQAPLVVAILSPTNDALVDRQISIEASITVLKALSYVEISLDNQLLKKIDAPVTSPLRFDFDPKTTSAGKHQLTVKAYDTDGFSGEATTNINVTPANGGGGLVVILAVLALAGILIPIGLRSRRKRQAASSSNLSVTPVLQAAESAQPAVLLEIEGSNPGQAWPLNRDETRLGRKANENNIPLKGTGASRFHAVIRRNGNQYTLSVLNPDNPVLVNQAAVFTQKILETGDVLQAGETTLRFEA